MNFNQCLFSLQNCCFIVYPRRHRSVRWFIGGNFWEAAQVNQISRNSFNGNLTVICSSCDRDTTFCLMADPEESEASASPSTQPQYTCVCKEGFYIPNEPFQGFPSDKVELASSNYSCIPCPGGCLCDKDGNCFYGQEVEDFFTETLLRAVIGAVLGACVLCCVLMSLVVFRQRKCKVCACSGSTLHASANFCTLFGYRRSHRECGQF